MTINNYLDDKFIFFLDDLSEEIRLGQELRKAVESSQSKEMIIPVLGIQGMGKSTFINALLGQAIMPVGGDETTCVPVEAVYSKEKYAEVYLKNGQKKNVECTMAALTKLVDNNYNPGNKLGVERIVVHLNSEILKTGITLVDLPGVGSLTEANEATTMHYLENIGCAIFMMQTNSTNSRMNGIFIKSLWSQFTKAIFIQNTFFNELPQDINDGAEWNKNQLRLIADSIGLPFDEKAYFICNVDKASKGIIHGEKGYVEESNIQTIINSLHSMAMTWIEDNQKILIGRIRFVTEKASNTLKSRLQEINLSFEDVKRKRKKNLQDFQEETYRIEDMISTIKKYIIEQKGEIYELTKGEVNKCIGQIRAHICDVIDSGNTDGERLAEAFKDEQEEAVKPFEETIINKILEVRRELTGKLNELGTVIMEEKLNPDMNSFDRDSSLKYEKGLEGLIDIGGAYAGWLAGSATAGAIGGSWGGPIGMAVGAAVGIAIGAAGHAIGNKVKDKRKAEAKDALDSVLDGLESSLKSSVKNKTDNYFGSIRSKTNAILNARQDEEDKLRAIINKPVDDSRKEEIDAQLDYIKLKLKELNDVK